jgi:SNF2 family DNA or RNA helicase
MVDRGLFLLTAGVGTGKTPMTVAALEELADEFPDFCGLVVCSGGLKDQWRDQILAFTCEECCGKDITDPTHPDHDSTHVHVGASDVLVIDGSPDKRWDLYEQAERTQPMYVIVGYDQVIDDNNKVAGLPMMFVVVDEITTIKNPNALVTQACRSTLGDAPFRFGLTGTPMENGKPEELFQIMSFIDDSVLGRPDIFDSTFVERNKWGTVRKYMNLSLFHEMMQDCSASIDADDPGVRDYMPTMRKPKRILIDFDPETARVYQLMSKDLQQELTDAAKRARGGFDIYAHYAGETSDAETQGKIMSKISCMRMLCAHPDQLINSGEEYFAQLRLHADMDAARDHHIATYGEHDEEDCPSPIPDHKCSTAKSHKCPKPYHPTGWPKVKRKRGDAIVLVPKGHSGSAYAAKLLDEGELDDLIETPKMDELCLDIDKVLDGTCECPACADRTPSERRALNKIVVFSYHKMALRVLEERYGEKLSTRYDGDMPLKARNLSKQRFQREPETRLFLTSDAGGYGVDLPQGNHLFNYDKPFTAGRVTQRNARVRRANLDFHTAVNVRDYLIWNTLEVYYANITQTKEAVVQAVRTGQAMEKVKITAASLAEFLREHDPGAAEDDVA